jgi:hypothetical protein
VRDDEVNVEIMRSELGFASTSIKQKTRSQLSQKPGFEFESGLPPFAMLVEV